MKKIIVALLFLLCVSFAKAEPVFYTDPDALAYISSRSITDTNARTRLHAFCRGLKNLNLWTSVTELCILKPEYNAISSTTVNVVAGNVGTITGSLPVGPNGAVFDGTGANYISFNNPLANPSVAHSIAIVFSANDTGSYQYLIGGHDSAGSQKGPQLFANGNTVLGYNKGQISQYHSADGIANPAGYTGNSLGYLCPRGATTQQELVISTFSASTVSIQKEIDPYYSASGSFGTAYNGRATWTVGRAVTTASNPLRGTVALYIVFNKSLATYEADALRRLIYKTVGFGTLPKSQVIWEGDSLTFGSSSEFIFQGHLWTNVNWNVIANGNIGTPGDSSVSAVTQFPTQVAPLSEDEDFFNTVYYSLYIGANDLGVTDANTVFNRVKTLWYQAKQLGFKVIAWTATPSTGIGYSALGDNNRQTFNQLVRQSGGYDYLVDLANLPYFRNPVNLSSPPNIGGVTNNWVGGITNNATFYQADGIHFTTAGHAYIAAEVVRVIPNP